MPLHPVSLEWRKTVILYEQKMILLEKLLKTDYSLFFRFREITSISYLFYSWCSTNNFMLEKTGSLSKQVHVVVLLDKRFFL